MIKGIKIFMNNILKLLTISAISCAVIANCEITEAQTTCVKPVQGFVSIGLFGSQNNINGNINLKKLKESAKNNPNSAIIKELAKQGKYIDKETLNKNIKITPTIGEQTTKGLKDWKIKLYQIDSIDGDKKWINNSNDVIKPTLVVEKKDDNTINIVSTTDSLGNSNTIPVNSKYENLFKGSNGAFEDPITAGTPRIIPATTGSVYDAEHPAPTITQQVTINAAIDESKIPGDLYEVNFGSDDSKNSSSLWTAKGWQLSGFANVGLLVNFPMGGAWYLSFFGVKPFANRTQVISFDTTENSSNKDDKKSDGINAKNKGTLGIETGLRCNVTDKVWLGIGGGMQRSWYGMSLSSSNNDSNSNESNGEKQNMVGNAFFTKFSVGFVATNNIGVEVFAKYTGKHDLKTSTSKKSSSSDNSSSTDWPVDFTCPGAASFGICCTFTF